MASFPLQKNDYRWVLLVDSFICSNIFLVITHFLPGSVLGPGDTRMVIIISALKEHKSGEEMIFKPLLYVVGRDAIKIFAKLGEVRRAQMSLGLSLSE